MSPRRLVGKYFSLECRDLHKLGNALFPCLGRRCVNKLHLFRTLYEVFSCGKACNVRWPCKGYDAYFTTSACPVMWTASGEKNGLLRLTKRRAHHPSAEADGKICEAPPSYVGPCDPVQRIRRPENFNQPQST